jgi:NAD+ synthase
VGTAELATALGIDAAAAQRVYDDIAAKRRAAAYLHAAAETIEPVYAPG